MFTQPTQVNVAVVSFLPLRIAIVLLVACAWAFLLQPARWIRRALLAFVVPTAAILLFFIVPPTASQVFGWGSYRALNNKFAPYWVAASSDGKLFATDLDGRYVWVFDSSGNPQGVLNAARAPAPEVPGPGIIPSSLESELNTNGVRLFGAVPTPVYTGTGALPRSAIPNFDFCGIATDTQSNLYLVDLYDPTGYKLLRFDPDGNITARWPLPPKYQPTNACVAADSRYIYLGSIEAAIGGVVYVLDHNGKIMQQVRLPFQPLAISANDKVAGEQPGDKVLVVAGLGSLQRLVVRNGSATLTPLAKPPNELQVPILLIRSGQVVMSDHQNVKVSRFDPVSGRVVGTIGKQGVMPGELGGIGGLAEDNEGRIFISDPVNRVMQRFEQDSSISAVWWAQSLTGEVEQEGVRR